MIMKRWFKIGVAGLLIWLLIQHVDWSRVGTILVGTSLPWIGLYVFLQLFGNLISAKKWQYLATLQNFHFSLKESFFAYLAGAFINNFFPSVVGGDTYRTLWMKKMGDGWQAITVVIFDRLSGLLALFLLASLGFFTLPWSIWVDSIWLFLLAAIILSCTLVICLGAFYAYGIFELFVSVSKFLSWEKLTGFLERFRIFAEGKTYMSALAFSILFTLIGIGLNNFVLFHALGAEVSPFLFMGCIFLATLVANIPLSINNIGIKEWAYVFFFGLVGVSAELAVATALLSRFLQMLLSLGSLPWYLSNRTAERTTFPMR